MRIMYIYMIITLSLFTAAVSAAATPKNNEVKAVKRQEGVIEVSKGGINSVPVSTTKINRITSDTKIYNIQKPDGDLIVTKIDKVGWKDVFLRCNGKSEEIIHITTEAGVYTLQLKPKNIAAQKVHLAGNKKKEIIKLLGNKREKLAVQIIKAAYSEGDLLDNARKSKLSKKRHVFKGIVIKEHLRYDYDDEGLALIVYVVKLANNFKYPEYRIEEKNFLTPELAPNPIAIALSRNYLTKKDYVRLFVLGGND